MTRRAKVILGCLAILALLTCACTEFDMDRSEWGWDGSQGDEPPHVEEWNEKAEADNGRQ